jgi:hypothetical protein
MKHKKKPKETRHKSPMKCRTAILGVSECRWLGSGKVTINSGHTILYSEFAIIINREKIKH